MFARYFVEISMDPGQIEAALLTDPRSWLPRIATAAHERGDDLLAAVGFGERAGVRRQVHVDLGEPVHAATKTIVPLRWTAVGGLGHRGFFPQMEADLEIAPLAPRQSQLAMSARYVPPLGVLDRALDRAVLFRVAEATIKDFLDHVKDRLVGGPSVASGRRG